jgi:N-acetylglucosaminyldiphosphoundecaprenol N-acetyl-beta-D-mannosaminyltransferase
MSRSAAGVVASAGLRTIDPQEAAPGAEDWSIGLPDRAARRNLDRTESVKGEHWVSNDGLRGLASAEAARTSGGGMTPRWMSRWNGLFAQIHWCDDPSAYEALTADLASPHPSRTRVVAFVNAHAMNIAADNDDFGQHLATADVLLRDGVGLAILARLRGREAGLNMNGTDFIPVLLRRFNGRPIALLGTLEATAASAARKLRSDIAPHSPVVSMNGFESVQAYVDAMARERPSLIVLGMGMPKQEAVAAALRERLGHACLIVCGGAILDFMAGRASRAPLWMRESGLEWAYRLFHEPRRLFARYVVGNPKFLSRALRLR